MYGLILENLAEYIKSVYGEDKWEEIRQEAGISSTSFGTHTDFDESLLIFLAETAQEILEVNESDLMEQMGVYFVEFVEQYGYDRVLSVLGRHVRDFLNGLDNLHEYLKFSYPMMRAPSFICEDESRHGLTLHYRTKRKGFVYYTMGIIREVARHFYYKDMQIDLVQSDFLGDTCHYTFKLSFDNREYSLATLAMTREEKHLPISASILFQMFPFCMVFGPDMLVHTIGNSLMQILPDLLGKKIIAWFSLKRPMIEFKYDTILDRTNNIFKLIMNKPVKEQPAQDKRAQLFISQEDRDADIEKRLRLKGQMVYMESWDMIIFLCTPVLPRLNALISTGLYINDLSMHDFSRDLMLAGTQQSVELKLALDQEKTKSRKLEQSMRKLDEEMRRTDELLYQMIPKQIADRLRAGESPVDTCEMFSSVSILYSDVVEICSRITPMQVIAMLNTMYLMFDKLTEKNNVHKVETIGDAYITVSGAPVKDMSHAEHTCDMALDILDAISDLKDPSTGQHLRIRVGIHSGPVVAGIVGFKMPRYCLFGESVYTAEQMEVTCGSMKVHISQATKDLLPRRYRISEAGEVASVKGKETTIRTYWLEECEDRIPLVHPIIDPSEIVDIKARKPTIMLSQPPITLLEPPSMDASRNTSSTTVTVKELTQKPKEEERFGETNRKSFQEPRSAMSSARRSRANSIMQREYETMSPSELFGALISDTEDFIDDIKRSSPQIFTPQAIARPPSMTKMNKETPQANGFISQPLKKAKAVDQLNRMVQNMSPSKGELPGLVCTDLSCCGQNVQAYKGLATKSPIQHCCHYNYNSLNICAYHKEPQCMYSRHRMHTHACSIL